ncbi:Sorting nexin mvp1 [Puccinia graminis f. sp. tritici]|uniref:Sorting nexin MVP1 n=1 Tax=Puccinia graminis f. sp. tritici TaxID=56615 RepID=A0A5B0R1L5_PUCGR|nr:Sorting nexin mvp1 [Puccinia graminis f. sp. tritici]
MSVSDHGARARSRISSFNADENTTPINNTLESPSPHLPTSHSTGELFTTPASTASSTLLSQSSSDAYVNDPWSPKLLSGSNSVDGFEPDPRLQGNINDSALPIIYHQAFNATDPSNGTASIANVHRVLASSGVGASAIEQILSVSCGRSSRVSKQEFSIALAAVAFAQQGRSPLCVQRIISRKGSFPLPTLDLGTSPNNPIRSQTQRAAFPEDPWCTSPSSTMKARSAEASTSLPFLIDQAEISAPRVPEPRLASRIEPDPQFSNSRFLPTFNPLLRDSVSIRMSSPEGWLLKHNVYTVEHERKGTSVPRRYSDFVWLHECLLKRYPFRLLPILPPKRLAISGHHLVAGDDSQFLERRRRGLQRCLNFLVNHPVLSIDSILITFLSEPSDLATWRSHSRVHLVEESVTTRLTPAEEMSIPEDLDNHSATFRSRLPLMIEHWGRICNGLERMVRRNEAQSVDLTKIQFAIGSALESGRAALNSEQSEWTLNEVQRAEEETELVGQHIGKHAEIIDHRAGRLSLSTQEQIRAHKELFTNFVSLFDRIDRLSGDDVDERLKPRAELNTRKMEAAREAQKPGWEDEVDKLKNLIEQDRAGIEFKLRRRVFIRWCLWQEIVHTLRVASLIRFTWKEFVDHERQFSERSTRNWSDLIEIIDSVSL